MKRLTKWVDSMARENHDKLDAIINTAESVAHAIGSKSAKGLILMRKKGEIK